MSEKQQPNDQGIVVRKKKKKFKVFPIVNVILFLLISAMIIIPIWKVIVDSLDAVASYGMRAWPQRFTWEGYKIIVSNISLYRPFLISCLVTVAGTFIGLLVSTLGA